VKKPGYSQIAIAEECPMEGHFFYPVSKKPGSLVQGNHELDPDLRRSDPDRLWKNA